MITLENVCKHFNIGNKCLEILKNVDLTVKKHDYLALMGHSGSGKSTLLYLLGLLDRPNSGKYYLNGKNTGELDDEEISALRNKKIGFIFQAFNLFPNLNILENVEVPFEYGSQKNNREYAVSLLEKVGLAGRMNHKPTELSGGEMQRVAIARALVNKPDIIIADEPTGNLDEKTGYEILDIFDRLNEQGAAIIMATHNQEFKKRVKRVVLMKDGRIKE
jgi:putative ABC transport system ATP-binding protein